MCSRGKGEEQGAVRSTTGMTGQNGESMESEAEMTEGEARGGLEQDCQLK